MFWCGRISGLNERKPIPGGSWHNIPRSQTEIATSFLLLEGDDRWTMTVETWHPPLSSSKDHRRHLCGWNEIPDSPLKHDRFQPNCAVALNSKRIRQRGTHAMGNPLQPPEMPGLQTSPSKCHDRFGISQRRNMDDLLRPPTRLPMMPLISPPQSSRQYGREEVRSMLRSRAGKGFKCVRFADYDDIAHIPHKDEEALSRQIKPQATTGIRNTPSILKTRHSVPPVTNGRIASRWLTFKTHWLETSFPKRNGI